MHRQRPQRPRPPHARKPHRRRSQQTPTEPTTGLLLGICAAILTIVVVGFVLRELAPQIEANSLPSTPSVATTPTTYAETTSIPTNSEARVSVGNDNEGVSIEVIGGDKTVTNIITKTLSPTPSPTPTLFPPASEDETLILVADFVDPTGDDTELFTQNLVEELRETLADHPQIRIEYLQDEITPAQGSKRARQIAADPAFNADIVIWGNYTQSPDLQEPQVHVHFDIIQEQDTYLETGFYERHTNIQLFQPSMFSFQLAMGEYLGEMVAFTAGLILFEDGLHNRATIYFDTAAQAIGDPLAGNLAPIIRFYRGTNYLHLGQIGEAKEELVSIESLVLENIAQFKSNTSESVLDEVFLFALNSLGLVYDYQGDDQKALEFYEQALSAFRMIEHPRGEVTIQNNIGGIYRDRGEINKALEYLLPLANVSSEEILDPSAYGIILNNIGDLYHKLDEADTALTYHQKALDIFNTIDIHSGKATTLNNMGLIYYESGNSEEAIAFFEEALFIYRKVDYRIGEVDALYNISFIHYSQNNIANALDYLQQAAEASGEINDALRERRMRQNIALIHVELNKLEEAKEQLLRIVEIDEATNHPDLDADRAWLEEIEAQIAEGN